MSQPIDLLDRAAAARPHEAALVTPGARWSFGQLAVAVDRAAAWLAARGVRPRHTVALDVTAPEEWILTLATMRLAARSVSLAGISGAVDLAIDHIVVDERRASRFSAVSAVPVHAAPGARLAADGEAEGAPHVPYPRADSVVRYVLTSGTTGTPKAARFTLLTLAHRLAHLDAYWTDARPELDLMPLSTTGGLHTALACLRHGTPYLAVDRIDVATMRLAREEGIAVLAGSPQQIGLAMRVMRDHRIDLPQLDEVRVAGATPSGALIEAIDRELGARCALVYGSTESGGVTRRTIRPGDSTSELGPIIDGVEVRVVTERGEPVTAGADGYLEVRGRGVADGYETRDGVVPFPRGWFRSGDRALLREGGMLVLAGRDDALINVGGVKVDPDRIDGLALAHPGVHDVATVLVERSPGIPEIALALVAEPDAELRALDRALRAAHPVGHPTLFVRVATIARTRTGKVRRDVVAAELMRALSPDG
ncbi:MAG TPA: class I adenylate-forming enzyme family protein [Microcella sp.]|nr:class I adenylate-forming enzyme family protein [Microcella sp.]